jgi:hypothetical protein
MGVDLNRNWNVTGYGIGASSSPCSETFKVKLAAEVCVQQFSRNRHSVVLNPRMMHLNYAVKKLLNWKLRFCLALLVPKCSGMGTLLFKIGISIFETQRSSVSASNNRFNKKIDLSRVNYSKSILTTVL